MSGFCGRHEYPASGPLDAVFQFINGPFGKAIP